MRPSDHAEGLRDRPFHLAPQPQGNLAERTQSGADHAIADAWIPVCRRQAPPAARRGFWLYLQ